jgi:SAM-dependent methyltransferase
MLKMYQFRSTRGDAPAFWEENWRSGGFEDGVRFCEIDPLRPLFEQYVPRGGRMLEGGCGLGQYVAYYTARGRAVIGLDFALDTLARLRSLRNDLALCAGNVATLPFHDGTFDAYYSGGVVEHFEGGPEPALREARRVLRAGGVLLVSVPYFSPLRRALSPFRGRVWTRLSHARVDAGDTPGGRRFWQYAYTPEEFGRLLSDVGFRVVTSQAYSILWGLYDLPFFAAFVGRFSERIREKRRATPAGGASLEASGRAVVGSAAPGETSLSLAKRLLVREDVTVPLAGWVVRMLRGTCANMMMYVCVQGKEARE